MNANILSLFASKHESRLKKCLSAVDVRHASPKDLFEAVDDEFWFWLNTHGYRQNVSLQQILPAMPDDVTQDRFTGLHGDANLASAFDFYKLVKQIAETNLGGLDRCDNVLDFGCGWGRIIRFFLRDLAPAQIWGIDCLPEAIEICRATNRWCQFQLVPAMPPSGLPAASFDLVYAFSVFSHLSEDAHRRWLGEFHRLLKPGGLVVLTTRDREFINYCEVVRKQSDRPFFAGGTAAAFRDTAACLAAYDRGEFCHTPASGGGTLADTFYGETCIPKKYVATHWTKDFSLLDFIDDRARCDQNVIVARRK